MEQETFTKLPVCRLYNDQILLFEVFDRPPPRSEKQKANEKNLTRGDYNGYMSPKTKSKVKKYLNTWVESITAIRKTSLVKTLDKVPYLTFVTLTLPAKQCHEDNEIKRKCLTPFIATLQRKFDVWHYFWRAEAQKNGNIHFHLIIDSFIPHAKLRMEWNHCINKLGYVDTFEKSFKHNNPNSTDIHSFKNIHSPASYVIKYCTKTDNPNTTEYRKINGRIHGCSDELRNLVPYEDLIDGKIDNFLKKVQSDPETKTFISEDFTVMKCSVQKMLAKYYPHLSKTWFRYKVDQAKRLYTIELPPDIVDFVVKKERKRLIQMELFQW